MGETFVINSNGFRKLHKAERNLTVLQNDCEQKEV